MSTGLHKILDLDYGIEEPYWGTSLDAISIGFIPLSHGAKYEF